MFNNVVFPAPEGPIIAVISPELNFPDIPWRICFVAETNKIIDLTSGYLSFDSY